MQDMVVSQVAASLRVHLVPVTYHIPQHTCTTVAMLISQRVCAAASTLTLSPSCHLAAGSRSRRARGERQEAWSSRQATRKELIRIAYVCYHTRKVNDHH